MNQGVRLCLLMKRSLKYRIGLCLSIFLFFLQLTVRSLTETFSLLIRTIFPMNVDLLLAICNSIVLILLNLKRIQLLVIFSSLTHSI